MCFSVFEMMEEVGMSQSDDESMRSEECDSTDAENGDDEVEGNPGLADALAKVIRMSKNKNGKSIVLSKAKLYSPNQVINKKNKSDFDIEPDPNAKVKIEKDEKTKDELGDFKEDKKLMKNRALKKQERLHRGRLKPSALDRDKERPLMKIATRGVVQLFNAVKQQQSAISKEVNRPGVTEGKKERILKSVNKAKFLEVLRGKNVNTNTSQDMEDDIKEEPEDDNSEPSWHVLRDDFMIGAKLKDWDKNEASLDE